MSSERLDKYGYFMHDIARKSGEFIRDGFDASLNVTFKSDNTPVTQIDKAVDHMVMDDIQRNFPGHGYLGEEAGGETNAESFWVCDPLDGTRPYINGLPLAAFSLSLVERGEVVSSIIHDPFTNRSVISAKNEGAWLNGHRLHVSERRSLDNADVHTSWGDERYIERVSALRKVGAKVVKIDATVYIGMLVSMGKMDADIFTGDKLWDVAAQSLIVSEAGGRATTLSGDDIVAQEVVDGLIISNGYIHDEILEIVQASRK
jgi:fructose-1,6-bisphosphatase/inositol monophosphatase family enzyme